MTPNVSGDGPLAEEQALLALYQGGDGDAAAVLLSRYIPLIHRYAHQFQGVLDSDDLIQEGCIGFLDAIRSFDPDSGVKFSSYASVCIKNRMLKAVEKAPAKRPASLTTASPWKKPKNVPMV